MISKVVTKNAYKVEPPLILRKLNVFNISLQDHNINLTVGQPPSVLQVMIAAVPDNYYVDQNFTLPNLTGSSIT